MNTVINTTMEASQLIAKMLKENTGTHFLDSGQDNGRQWQRNQAIEFEQTPRIEFEVYGDDEINETVSTFHYLSEVLELDDQAVEFNKYFDELEEEDKQVHWVQEATEYLEDYDIQLSGDIVNTYNGENNLSQVLLFQVFMYNDEPYVILQIHGGADVRGGYTDARVFKLNGYLTGQVDVYGSIGDKYIENTYNGWKLTYEDGEDIEGLEEIDHSTISMDFTVNDDTYMYEA